MLPQASVDGFRDTLTAVNDRAVSDLVSLWRSWSWDDALSVSRDAQDVMPGVVWAWQDVAAALAADQYDEWRELERVPGRFVASPAALAAEDQVLAGVRNAVGSLFGSDPDVEAARSLLAGSLSRHVMHGATDTVVDATAADPQAVGWSRHARPGACKFCRMLAGRGGGSIGVYRSEKSARFASHDHCHCTAFPSWDRDAPEVDVVAYVASVREQTLASRARVKAYLEQMD